MNKSEFILNYMDELYPEAACELLYDKDYELLIAVVLSAQCTDKRVNVVTRDLFSKYTLKEISCLDLKTIESIIKSVGTYTRKSIFVSEIAKSLIQNYDGIVPNNRAYLENLPGVGHKTANVVLSNLFDVPAIAVDTHVSRVSKRLELAEELDDVVKIEKKLMKFFPEEKWSRLHHQLVLFGRYQCKAQKPICDNCNLKTFCKEYQKKI